MTTSTWSTTAVSGSTKGSWQDSVDALLWFVLSLLVLSSIEIGAVTGDGLVRSSFYEQRTWTWNPNHLLMDPVGALWHKLLTMFGSPRAGPDQQKLLSIWSGAIAIAIFRWRLAPLIAVSRFAANHGIAWLALGSVFLRLWISDKTPMTQMPFLVLAAVALLEYNALPRSSKAIAAGLYLGVATLFFVSNIVLAFVLALGLGLWYAARRDWREASVASIAIGGSAAGLAGMVFLISWLLSSAPESGFFNWLTNYAGGAVSERTAGSYGIDLSLSGAVTAFARSLYGSASAVVDMAPIVQLWRDRDGSFLRAGLTFIAGASAGCAVILSLWRQHQKTSHQGGLKSASTYWIVASWTLAVILFGMLWNDSDDQFYLQLAIPLGIMMAGLGQRSRRTIVVLGIVALSFNVILTVRTYVMYPREERIALLESTIAGAGLVIYPGYDELDNLFFFTDRVTPVQRISITYLALHHDVNEGMEVIKMRVQDALSQGQDVVVLSLYDVAPNQSPWKYVQRLGFDREEIIKLLNTFNIETESQRSGPFTVRRIHGS